MSNQYVIKCNITKKTTYISVLIELSGVFSLKDTFYYL